jgi:hypothetical protein
MKAKEQYKLAHRYHRIKNHLRDAEAAHRYPIDFDCAARYTCGDCCYCSEEAERETTQLKAWQLEMASIESKILGSEMIAIAFEERLRWAKSNSVITCEWDFGIRWGYGKYCHFAGLVRSGYLAPFRLYEMKKGTERGDKYRAEIKDLFFRVYHNQ